MPDTAKQAQAALAIALIAIAGCVDAIAYVEFGRVFVSFMSGNSTRGSIHAAEGAWGALALPASAIGGFVLGAFIGTMVGIGAGPLRVPAVLGTAAGVAAIVPPLVGAIPPAAAPVPLLGLAMGVQNTAMGKIGDIEVNLTFVTGTVARFGAGLANVVLGRKKASVPLLLFGLWSALVGGAALGTALHRWAGIEALFLPVGALLALALAAWAGERKMPSGG
ncbi:uncharacterized membrane protein YoaK (UPF0700 family) [Hasllibacter halocynthiae]|uniref:Uncharacterized membrane protein YoaK (UPF0700 family) n=1 Tax=Hasllibacter halocynthiae TaxID=595589 RepID=A0A2T0WZF1_9RHOB|nr:YoaK family protein [Hasllibacter halocynthiae]PRY92047.1 uncharacterized membrane protein YoaK (UPF0700 family) [Hasllibacter halocynthiae]